MPRLSKALTLAMLPLSLLAFACDSADPSLSDGNDGSNDGDGSDGSGAGTGTGAGSSEGGGSGTETVDPALAARVIDYNEALRTAALKLTRRLPTLEQINKVRDADDPEAAYAEELDAMLASPAFNGRMVKLWRDIMRMGGDGLDSAPAFAAKLMAEQRPFTELFTATSGNCPTFDADAGTFADGDCASNAPVQAGVLTDPAVQRQFYGNMAFRRVRWVQETFYCSKMPAEVVDQPTQVDGKDYTSPWDFQTVSTTPIDFQDTQSVVCANCHTTINHVAPLFANFDENGMWQNSIQVKTPIAPDPVTTEMSHWLRDGETLAWHNGRTVTDLASLGQVLAEDPAISECMVARMWNFALSKEDIVTDLATVPFGVVQPHIDEFDNNGQDLKAVLRGIFLSEDFVSF